MRLQTTLRYCHDSLNDGLLYLSFFNFISDLYELSFVRANNFAVSALARRSAAQNPSSSINK